MSKILLGAPVKERIKEELIKRISKLQSTPCLAVVQVGDRDDSTIYINNKKKFGEEIGVKVNILKFPENINEIEISKEIERLNLDQNVAGIIVQLPLPPHLNSKKIIDSISLKKDADGLSSIVEEGDQNVITPATARAVGRILDFYNISVKNKKVAVIGRSKLAGGPIAKMLEQKGAQVSVCQKETTNTKEICLNSDLIISATGQAGLITQDFVKGGQVVIDVGINRVTPLTTEKPKITGDVLFEQVEPVVFAITPVPGGVGPLTVACLFENLLDLVEKG